MPALIDMIEGRRIAGHRPWPRVVVSEDVWRFVIGQLAAGHWTLLGLWGDFGTANLGAAHMAVLNEREIAVITIECPSGHYPSVGALHPPAIRLERALRDLFGIEPVGLPDTRPWLDLGFWDVQNPLGTRRAPPAERTSYTFLPVEGENLPAAQEATVVLKVEKPNGTITFVGGRVITMEGDEVLSDGVVVVYENHISAVGRKGEVKIPVDAKIIDVQGKTIIPGIIDTHAHQPQGSNGIIPQQNWSSYATLAFGVTTLFNPNAYTGEIFRFAEMQKAGHLTSPRIFSTGMSFYGAYEPGHTTFINSLEDARFHMDRFKRVGAFAMKMHHQPRREQYQQIIKAAGEYEMMVLSEGGALLQQDLGKIADGASSIEHSVALAKIYEDVYQFWSQSQTASVPTLVVSFGGISGENYWYAKTDVWKHPRLSKYVPQDILAPRSMRRELAPDHHYNHFNVVKSVKAMNDRGITVGIGGHGQREDPRQQEGPEREARRTSEEVERGDPTRFARSHAIAEDADEFAAVDARLDLEDRADRTGIDLDHPQPLPRIQALEERRDACAVAREHQDVHLEFLPLR
jgi:imidazolonepropionase-like amidohydrolase